MTERIFQASPDVCLTNEQLAAMVEAAGGDSWQEGATADMAGDHVFKLDPDALRKLLAGAAVAQRVGAATSRPPFDAADGAPKGPTPGEARAALNWLYNHRRSDAFTEFTAILNFIDAVEASTPDRATGHAWVEPASSASRAGAAALADRLGLSSGALPEATRGDVSPACADSLDDCGQPAGAVPPVSEQLLMLVERWTSNAEIAARARSVDDVGVAAGYRSCAQDLRIVIAQSTESTEGAPAEQLQRLVHLRADRERRVYIAGPMTGLPEFNFPAFNLKAEELRAAGWHVENPAEHGHVEGAVRADYLRWDLSRIVTCGAIHLLPGWSKSKGANLEVYIAQILGMDIQIGAGAESVACAFAADLLALAVACGGALQSHVPPLSGAHVLMALGDLQRFVERAPREQFVVGEAS